MQGLRHSLLTQRPQGQVEAHGDQAVPVNGRLENQCFTQHVGD